MKKMNFLFWEFGENKKEKLTKESLDNKVNKDICFPKACLNILSRKIFPKL